MSGAEQFHLHLMTGFHVGETRSGLPTEPTMFIDVVEMAAYSWVS
jgi:predicted DNA-binding protein with PD1-like motif